MKRAIRAKLEQNPDLDRAFAETYPRPIEHPLKDRAGTRFPGEQFTRILADLRISIEAIRQPEAADGDATVPIIILTHRVAEAQMDAAIERIARLAGIGATITRIRMEEFA